MLSLFSLFLALSVCADRTFAATAEQWRSRAIYQLVTDRFARVDNTSAACDTADRKYCGGSWNGIVSHLDYIQQLGFDAVWISPVVENINGTSAYGEAYHGYWTKDINQLNSNYGTADDLKALSAALHSRGMYLMVDVVINHFAAIPTSAVQGNSTPSIDYTDLAPFNTESSFHPYCLIDFSLNNQTDVEQCWLGDTNLPLPDLNTEDAAIVQTMNTWIANLTKTYSIDGLRIDTVKHIRKDFWPDFASSAGVYTVGEVLDARLNYTVDYTNVIDGILDYPTYFSLTSAFGSTSGNLSAIPDVVTQAQKTYKNSLLNSGSFVENHDQPRFQNITKDAALVRNAITWPFVQDGVPILYYGQEQGYDGGNDPSNREALWLSGYVTDNKPLVSHVQALNTVRKLAATANSNFLSTSLSFIPQTSESALAVSKPPLISLLTNIGASASTQPSWTIPSSAKLFSANAAVVDVLTCTTIHADAQGALSVTAKGGMPQVLVPASVLDKSGTLCPEAAITAKTSGATGRRATVGMGALAAALLVGAVAQNGWY